MCLCVYVCLFISAIVYAVTLTTDYGQASSPLLLFDPTSSGIVGMYCGSYAKYITEYFKLRDF